MAFLKRRPGVGTRMLLCSLRLLESPAGLLNDEPNYSRTFLNTPGSHSAQPFHLLQRGPMSVLIIFNREPHDGTDVTWNGLRLAGKLREGGQDVRIFLMNDAVDLARDVLKKPETYDQDLVQMLKELIKQGVVVKVCGTCMARCGIHKN